MFFFAVFSFRENCLNGQPKQYPDKNYHSMDIFLLDLDSEVELKLEWKNQKKYRTAAVTVVTVRCRN